MIKLTKWEYECLIKRFPKAPIVATKNTHYVVCENGSPINNFIVSLRAGVVKHR